MNNKDSEITTRQVTKLFESLFFTPNNFDTHKEIKENNMIYEVAPNNPSTMWLTNSRIENSIQINSRSEKNKIIIVKVFSLSRIFRFILSPFISLFDYITF